MQVSHVMQANPLLCAGDLACADKSPVLSHDSHVFENFGQTSYRVYNKLLGWYAWHYQPNGMPRSLVDSVVCSTSSLVDKELKLMHAII